jgi:Holliday junction resolvase RusA-like endonuclease
VVAQIWEADVSIKFSLPVEPKGQMRPRFTRIGKYHKAYKHSNQKAEEAKLLGLLYEHKPPHPLDGALELKVAAHIPIPKSWPKWKKQAALDGEIRPAKKPDWDNIGKQICDVFNGIFWNDDAQIVGAMVQKYYSDSPRWEIEIRQAD